MRVPVPLCRAVLLGARTLAIFASDFRDCFLWICANWWWCVPRIGVGRVKPGQELNIYLQLSQVVWVGWGAGGEGGGRLISR